MLPRTDSPNAILQTYDVSDTAHYTSTSTPAHYDAMKPRRARMR